MFYDESWLLTRMLILIPLILSLSVHEWAHAWTARMLGDRTAEAEGRLTLNPLSHIDPIGTVLLPLLGVPIGWAKPVPINPAFFRRGVTMRVGIVLTALAGPVSNICIAIVCVILEALLGRRGWWIGRGTLTDPNLVEMLIPMNVALAVFNMLPIPPLDGSRILDGLMPDSFRPVWEAVGRLGPWLILALIVLPALAGIALLTWPMGVIDALREALSRLIGN